MPIGLRVLFYERSDGQIKGPYPAIISSYNHASEFANLRVFIEDSFALYDLKNVPIYNPATEQSRFWSQKEIFSSSRFQAIANMIEFPDLDIRGECVQNERIPNKYGAFIKLLNENGCEDKEIYLTGGQSILVKQN